MLRKLLACDLLDLDVVSNWRLFSVVDWRLSGRHNYVSTRLYKATDCLHYLYLLLRCVVNMTKPCFHGTTDRSNGKKLVCLTGRIVVRWFVMLFIT